jgi:hypothetical protein
MTVRKVDHDYSACELETTMLASLDLEPISLSARSLHRIESARGTQVTCVRGATWITQANDPRDLILGAGQSVVLDRPGLAVVYTFRDAVITVGAPLEHRPALKAPAATRSYSDRAWA